MPSSRLKELESRARAIAATAPFSDWPREAQLRLARCATTARHARGAVVLSGGSVPASLMMVLEGAVQASVTTSGGRRVTFKVGSGSAIYALLPMLDGREMASDLVAIEPATAIEIPYKAIRAELATTPELWQSIARELGARARAYTEQLKQYVFDGPRVRMATLLLSLAPPRSASDGPLALDVRLPQERVAEVLGISRQWTTELVREMKHEKLVEWRYGRVTVLDLAGLRAIVRESINAARD